MASAFRAPRRHSRLAGYGLATLAVALATGARVALDPLFADKYPFTTFYPAMMVAAWFGGLWAGIVSTVLSSGVVSYMWLEPTSSLVTVNPSDLVALTIFVAVGILISALTETLHVANTREHAARQDANRAKEDAMRFANEARDSQQRVTKLIESLPAALVAVDGHGVITFTNALTEHLFGYAPNELIGQSVERLVPERFRPEHPRYRQKFSANPQSRPMGEGRDLYGLRKDGSQFPVEIALNPMVMDEQMVVLASIVDITSRKQAEDERAHLHDAERLARAEADAANRAKDVFLAMVSHEIRTPLNAILGWSDILTKLTPDETLRQRAIQAIHANAKQQAQLVNDLLDASRIMSGKLQIKREAVDLPSLIRATLEVVQPAATAKHVQIAVQDDESIQRILGDPTRLQQVLGNLLTNAIKFTPEKGTVHVRVRRAGDAIEIAVTDTGQGITPDFLPHVFEPFRQADSSTTRAHGGLGLGLALVKALVEAHGGTVAAESPGEGEGAIFTVRLPMVAVYEPSKETAAVGASPTQDLQESVSLEGVTVLVVDDDADSRQLIAAHLENAHATVLMAASVREARRLVNPNIDVMLVDIAMPGEDGYTFIRTLRAVEPAQTASIPAAAVSSFTRDEDRDRALKAGFQEHLPKPVESQALVQVVARLSQTVRSH